MAQVRPAVTLVVAVAMVDLIVVVEVAEEKKLSTVKVRK